MEENKLIQLFNKYGKKLLVPLVALLLFGIWTYRGSSSGSQDAADFLFLERLFTQSSAHTPISEEEILHTQSITKRHPEVESVCAPLIALSLFAQERVGEAVPYAELLLKQSAPSLPLFYKEYAKATCLIAKEEYQEAYHLSLTLQEAINHQDKYQNLYAMNLLRLLFLADELGHAKHKDMFWKELQCHPIYPTIASVLQKEDLTLASFIQSTIFSESKKISLSTAHS